MEKYFLKITSAVAINGEIVTAGNIVEVSEVLAKDLLRRGKAELATDDMDEAPAEEVKPLTKAEKAAAAKAAKEAEEVAKAEAEAKAKADADAAAGGE